MERKDVRLSEDQLNAIVEWLNEWEEIKGTAIPLRFAEDFKLEATQRPDSYWLQHCRDKIMDISQWSSLALSRSNLTPRVMSSLMGDIQNRCSD